MFFTLSDRNHVFQRRECSRLISVVPLCARTVIFFCDDLNFYHYSLVDEKILYQSKLPGRVRSAISISGYQILCTVLETRNLILLNLREKTLDEICKLPQTKMYNDGRERDVFTQTTLHLFQNSNAFYIMEPVSEECKARVCYHPPIRQDSPVSHSLMASEEFSTKKMILRKLDSVSKLVLFNQEVEDNGTFKFNTIDCREGFKKREYALGHASFTRFSIVKEIRVISKEDERETMLIFVNSNEPAILIVCDQHVESYRYESKKIFLSTVLVNVQLGYAMFMFMPSPDDLEPDHNAVVELISISQGKVQDRKKLKTYNVVKSYEDDYLLHFRGETVPTCSTGFRTDHIICKKAHYMKMLHEKGFSDLSGELGGLIMRQLER